MEAFDAGVWRRTRPPRRAAKACPSDRGSRSAGPDDGSPIPACTTTPRTCRRFLLGTGFDCGSGRAGRPALSIVPTENLEWEIRPSPSAQRVVSWKDDWHSAEEMTLSL
jgi:hypothetical protein